MPDFFSNILTTAMKQILCLAILCLTFWSCNSTTEKRNNAIKNSKSTIQKVGEKFFQYNAIDYYINYYDESNVGELFESGSKSEIDSFKVGIILGDIPNSISDLAFIDKLEKIGYKKTIIDKSKFASIDKIFVSKTSSKDGESACIYVYRDILIFKKDGEVVGTAKICFGCMANQIKGTTANTSHFGQDGDYEKLKQLLRP
jgi:hypothetical protein